MTMIRCQTGLVLGHSRLFTFHGAHPFPGCVGMGNPHAIFLGKIFISCACVKTYFNQLKPA